MVKQIGKCVPVHTRTGPITLEMKASTGQRTRYLAAGSGLIRPGHFGAPSRSRSLPLAPHLGQKLLGLEVGDSSSHPPIPSTMSRGSAVIESAYGAHMLTQTARRVRVSSFRVVSTAIISLNFGCRKVKRARRRGTIPKMDKNVVITTPH